MKKIISFTKEGLAEKQNELNILQNDRINAVTELQRAREMGDLSENAAYKVARSRLSGIDRRIRYLERILKHVVVVEKRMDGRVGMGNTVIVQDGTVQVNLVIVDGHESDFMKGKISGYSPIGRALLGKRVGESIDVFTPGGKKTITILHIT